MIATIIFGVLALVLLILVIVLGNRKTYDKMMFGTIVGKYKGLSNGGYIVVEIKYQKEGEFTYSNKIPVTASNTFEVPLNFYDSCKIGDTGVFPFHTEGTIVGR